MPTQFIQKGILLISLSCLHGVVVASEDNKASKPTEQTSSQPSVAQPSAVQPVEAQPDQTALKKESIEALIESSKQAADVANKTELPDAIQMLVSRGGEVKASGTVGDLRFFIMQIADAKQTFLVTPKGYLLSNAKVYQSDGRLLIDTQMSKSNIPTRMANQRYRKQQQVVAQSDNNSDYNKIQQAILSSNGPDGAQAVWQDLGLATAITEGQSGAPIVYIFFDLNCPYCHNQWQIARKAIEQGRYQVRWVPIAVLKKSQQEIGATLSVIANNTEQNLNTWMQGGSIAKIDEANLDNSKLALIRNSTLFKRLNSRQVPTALYQVADGNIVMKSGVINLQ